MNPPHDGSFLSTREHLFLPLNSSEFRALGREHRLCILNHDVSILILPLLCWAALSKLLNLSEFLIPLTVHGVGQAFLMKLWPLIEQVKHLRCKGPLVAAPSTLCSAPAEPWEPVGTQPWSPSPPGLLCSQEPGTGPASPCSQPVP